MLHHLCVHCTILHYAMPFHTTLHHFVYAVPFGITLSHFTQRYPGFVYAVPFDITLSHFTQRYTVSMYAVPFDITPSHFTQRYTVCAYMNMDPMYPSSRSREPVGEVKIMPSSASRRWIHWIHVLTVI